MSTATERKLAFSGFTNEEAANPPLGKSEPLHLGLCKNERCKKGPDGTRGIVRSRKAKYCCPSCRVDVCRRNRKLATPEQVEKPRRKPRSDKKYDSHAERQKAYEWRKRVRESQSRMDKCDLVNYLTKMR